MILLTGFPCKENPTLISYDGSAGADSVWGNSPTYAAANAFKPDGVWYGGVNASATVWYKFDSKKVVSRIHFKYVTSWAPKSVLVVASNDCKSWKSLGYWGDVGTSGTQNLDIPCELQGNYFCYGIKTALRKSFDTQRFHWLFLIMA